jgi:ADP-ribose pyrophosphatase YjhB (NUDIX family)
VVEFRTKPKQANMSEEDHVVQKLSLDMTIPDQNSAWHTQNRLSEFCKSELRKLLDRVLSELSSRQNVLRFDLLELDLGDLSSDSLEEDFLESFERQLRNALDEKLSEMRMEETLKLGGSTPQFSSGTSAEKNAGYSMSPDLPEAKAKPRSLSFAERDLEIVLFFLETGALPWFASAAELLNISDKVSVLLQEQPEQLRPALAKQLENPVSRRRAVYQFEDHLLEKILPLISPSMQPGFTELAFFLTRIISDMAIPGLPEGDLKYLLLERAIEYAVFKLPEEQAQRGMFEMVLSIVADRVPERSAEFLESFEEAARKELPEKVTVKLVRHLALFENPRDRLAETGRVAELFTEQFLRSQGESELFSGFSEKGPESIPGNEKNRTQNQLHKRRPEGSVSTDMGPPRIIPEADERRPNGFEIRERQADSKRQLDRRVDESQVFSLYVQNAGLVLFHPYLYRFFEKLKLIEDGRFENNIFRVRAAFILQWLASGKQSPPEYMLPLNKILCGLEIYEPFPRDILLTEKEIEACDGLLETVVEHWSALKNTSAEGLRKSFVQREGVLEKEGRNWRLRVERKSYDLLLEKLPWGLSMIKLSWMKTLIMVEW